MSVSSAHFHTGPRNANRSRFGPRRKTGARRLRYLDLPGIFTLRDLRLRVITKT